MFRYHKTFWWGVYQAAAYVGLWLKRKYLYVQESASHRRSRPLECLTLAMQSVWGQESLGPVEEKTSAKKGGKTLPWR